MISSLLIANRGEIACRIIRTARRLGVRTVAVYSEADAGALHVRLADEAVAIGPAPARESYLVGEKIIAAARATGAEAIHPGYGFLSENADFADAVVAAGLVWIGPRSASIRAMGLKDAAKERMIAAGVPVTPGYLGDDQTPERLQAEADAIGYPVLIKAVAGGGGKGMRQVFGPADFAEALASCRREAAASFGDDRVLIEKYILSPRHIEVQVFGDTHGNVVHLFERDCSLQRRHQKVIEEAPAPGMDAATRARVCEAAVRAAKAVDYVGAGTIEFIADASEGLSADRIWFMEMNTRLQVEHPITEAITGEDLVEWQLRVASGEPLPKRQDELGIRGWAAEARLYAENPATGFLPSTGRLDVCDLDLDARVDTGVEEGATISPFYDPMIAKVIRHAETRERAFELLAADMGDVVIWPVKTNAAFLARLLADADVVAGRVDTGLIGRRGEALATDPRPSPRALTAAFHRLPHGVGGGVGAGLVGFRLNAAAETRLRLAVNGEMVTFERTEDGPVPGAVFPPAADGSVLIGVAGAAYRVSVPRIDGAAGAAAGDGAMMAPMPGRVISVGVAEGDTVTKGTRLVVLEAMKMEQALLAPFDGQVAELTVKAGDQVAEGSLLVRLVETG